MSDEKKDREQREEQTPTQPSQQPEDAPTSGDKEETQTVSLLDLMAEEDEEREKEGQPSARKGEDVDRDREDTPTGPPIPNKLSPPKPRALPPLAKDKTITSRPPESDEDATQVQPHVAFPGSRGQDRERQKREATSERRTEEFRRPPASRRTADAAQRGARPRRAPEREAPVRVTIPESAARPRARARRDWGGCLTRIALVGLLLALVGTAMGAAAAVIGYSVIAGQLPPVSELRERASDFETAVIYDSQGNQLYSFTDPNAGNRTPVSLDRISPHVISATIATEDARFYSNPGFDPIGIGRAIVQAAQEREIVSGASTITQQLARALLLDEEERTQRTFSRKVKEIILAAEMNRTYRKDEILELYLNEIYYGNLAYGIEAAAGEYFNKPASELTLAEASLLAGLPQAPAAYDPYTAPELALGRQSQVLGLMVQEGYITSAEGQAAIEASAPVVRNMEPPQRTINHPHFVFTVLQQLEEQLGAQAIYAGGLRVYTTLDPAAQRLAEETVAGYREHIASTGANNASLVALDPRTGALIALVGSVDFDDEEIRGQVNMALAPRQPGSSIKPLVYLSAMEEGWTPSTLIWDVPTSFPNGANPPYEPKNYDDEFHGPMRLRPALGNSYNIPAVKALEYVGVCPFIQDLGRFEIALDDPGCASGDSPSAHGLALALGGGEISPLEMTAAFATLSDQGRYHQPYTIQRIEDSEGQVLSDYAPPDPQGQQAIRAAHAYLLSNILSDNGARQPEFGANNNLQIAGHRVAAKTGTSGTDRFDVRDGWTIGYTPQIATAVWVGNTDPDPVGEGQSGYRMASPIWHDFMSGYLAERPAVDFTRPQDVVQMDICAPSGARAGADCSRPMTEVFAADQLPLEEGFVTRVPVDLWTGLRANDNCSEDVFEAPYFNLLVSARPDVIPRETDNARQWIEETAAGRAWIQSLGIQLPLQLPPEDECNADTLRPQVVIDQPASGQEIMGEVEVFGTARAPEFDGYQLEFGLSHDPGGWAAIGDRRSEQVEGGRLGTWDTSEVSSSGPLTLRLIVFGPDNPYTEENDPVTEETRVPLTLQLPTPTPTPTPTETPTPTQTPTASPSPTPTASGTPEMTPTPSPTTEPDPTERPITVTPIIVTFPAPTVES